MQHLLFICGRNRLRSPTAEAIFSQYEGIEALSAGLSKDAETPISGDLIDWADIIFVMEKTHRKKLAQQFSPLLKDKRIVVLDVPDHYEYMQPELVKLLEARVLRSVRL
jgi:predicted protein tyrosine phosphatase